MGGVLSSGVVGLSTGFLQCMPRCSLDGVLANRANCLLRDCVFMKVFEMY